MGVRFTFDQKILFKHCDPAGIVFFPRYFEMINDCVEHFFDAVLDWPFEVLLQTNGVPTAEISTRFLAPSRHGDHVQLALTVTRSGRSSLSYRIDATCGQETRFEAEATVVNVDQAGKPTAWPDAIRKKLQEDTS
ncbi:thioesterase family protein [Phaeobacter sp. HF9A]|uniref:acyl-CoA thioesterase n=1 Tax=Phaeobacter sp. HF9A TaxID=2721561 RepID=UPI0014320AF8|nr:thioesterase family protein [Phaeobacter sp. HF9A]NIZ12586.1 acyl-CoA thioesterase [Phaeobacter sp. HF9A]